MKVFVELISNGGHLAPKTIRTPWSEITRQFAPPGLRLPVQ